MWLFEQYMDKICKITSFMISQDFFSWELTELHKGGMLISECTVKLVWSHFTYSKENYMYSLKGPNSGKEMIIMEWYEVTWWSQDHL